MQKENLNYFIGLDAGTGSVGWAATDETYKLLKYRGKDLWGMRLFETAKTAEGRRLQRASRRRLERRHKRLMLLQELFAAEMAKTDSGFFQRLKESAFRQEDKSTLQKNSLFNDNDFSDKEYHEQYPTIHHLIKAWIKDTVNPDIRLLYLACHTIIKKRGHFLFEGQDFDSGNQFNTSINELFEYLHEDMGIEIESNSEAVKNILQDTSKKPSDKQKELYKLFYLEKTDKQKKAVMDLISGCTSQFADLFNDENFKEADIKNLSFSKINFDEKGDELANILGDKLTLILKAKAVYDCSMLSSIIGEEQYLSCAKVKIYEKHKADLAQLKSVIKQYHNDDYRKLFKDEDENEKNNYCSYAGLCKSGGKKNVIKNTATQEDFYAYLKKILTAGTSEKINDDYKHIMQEIELNTFLPKQVDKKNSNIPYQLRKTELEKILQTAEKYFPFLTQKDESGFTVKEKIILLLTFKIPYYIGPINDAHKKEFPDRSWVVKKENKAKEKITPWNFDKYVDSDATAEAFIKVRTNKCSYLIGEDVLPRHSLLYSEYTVLNELNNLKITVSGEDIFTLELKYKIYEGLFKKYKKVTQKTIKNFLVSESRIEKSAVNTITITGIDEECTSSLTSYLDFKKIIGDKIKDYSIQKAVEDIIRLLAIYPEGDGKRIVKKKIEQNYPNVFTEEEIKKIVNLRFLGWGRLSRKLLESVTADFPGYSEKINLITALRETNLNLMELLSKQYEFQTELENINAAFDDRKGNGFSYKNIVKDLFLPPSVKRSLWQTLKIVREIVSVQKQVPAKIFIEMARGEEFEKGRTKSRKTILQNLYKNCTSDSSDWAKKDTIAHISKKLEDEDNLKLRSDRLYLYYTQLGRCMYSGEPIHIEELFNTQLYDIDHIYPQSKIKDDSLTNRVLVKKSLNQNKKDIYPLDSSIQNKQKYFWNFLQRNGFISLEKLTRLIRTEKLSDKELTSFIARQLVETQQSTKAAASILKKLYPDTEIVYVKARNVSAFRDKFGFIKCREINDMHHAHDAYLNIVVGNVYHTKFTNNPWNFIKENKASENIYNSYDSYNSYNFYKLFDYEVKRQNKIAWQPDKSITQVKAILHKNTPLYTRMSFCQKGGFFDQTIMKKGKGQFPLKSSGALKEIEKYGGYNKVAAAYYTLVEYTEKDTSVRSLETIPVHLIEQIKKDKTVLNRYLTTLLPSPYRILVPSIKVNSLIKVNGFPCHITGKTNERFLVRSAVQFCCNEKDTLFFKRILNYNKVRAEYDRLKKSFSVYDDYTLRMFVEKEIWNKKDTSHFTEKDFEICLRQKNIEMYTSLLKRYDNSIYKNRPNFAVSGTLQKGQDAFAALTVEKQLEVLEEVLKVFRTINENCNFELINGKPTAGKTAIGKKISTFDECILIYQSVTGIFEKRINLLEL